MLDKLNLKNTVSFPEITTVPREQSFNSQFDIFQDDVIDNDLYCQQLINKILYSCFETGCQQQNRSF